LAWGPKCRFTLNDRRWAEIASCGWIYGPQHDWLIPQATQSRLDAATSRASNDLSVLADLLVVGVDLDTARVVAQLAGLDQSDEIDPPERERIGVSLQRAGNRAGLETLVASGEQWRTALRPYLAEVGSIDAQRQELQDLTRRLRDHVRPGDPSTLRWLAHITDVTLLPELEQALIAAGRDHRSDIVPDVTAPILRAITGLDPLQAIPVLDRLSRERPYPGAQFLIDERDRLVQSLLQTEGTIAAGQRAAALSLPWPAV
jgi:hypothetical protein